MRRRFLTWSLVVAGSLGFASRGLAAEGDAEAAESLFREGKELLAQGKLAEACAAFDKSQRLDPGVGTLFHLAECFERSGRTASAWNAYRDVESQTRAAEQAERARVAHARARALEPRLPYATLRVSPALRAVAPRIECDGSVVPPEQWDVPVPVDPGEHVIAVEAVGKAPFRATFAVAEEAQRVEIVIPLLADAPRALEPEPLRPSMPAAKDARTLATVTAVTLGALGIAGVTFGTYFGLRSISEHRDAASACNGTLCRAGGYASMRDALRDGDLSTWGFAAGGAALAGGGVLWFFALRSPPTAGSHVGVAPQGMALGWGGTW